jgi:membrane protease YdiL (CAAX protease family)/TM2 domain-containing membrane protein YozV
MLVTYLSLYSETFMRVCLLCLLSSLASVAAAQELPSSLPSSQPTSAAVATSLKQAANALSVTSAPTSEPGALFAYVEPRLPPISILERSNPVVAGALAVIPGAGHFYLGRPGIAAGYLGATAAFGLLNVGVRSGGAPGLVTGSLTQNLWFYNIFDAYRDARVKRADVDYQHPITREPLAKLVSSPFRVSVLKNPLVWVGVPAALIGGLGVSLLSEEVFPNAKVTSLSLRPTPLLRIKLTAALDADEAILIATGTSLFAAAFLPVGVGEEALFRGCFQSGLTQQFGPTMGWLTASLLFGAAHINNFVERDPSTLQRSGFNEAGYLAVPYITLVGAGLGYMYMRDDYKLEAGVAAHFWYDFLLSIGSLLPLATDGAASFQFSFPL